MKPLVVVTNWVHAEAVEYLRAHCKVSTNDAREPLPREEIARRARLADGLIVFVPDHIDAEFVDACPRLQVIAAAMKGYDNCDVDACTRRNVWFTIVPTLLTDPTAELIVGQLIGLGRHLLRGDEFVRSGQFKGWRPHFYGIGLKHRTLGIVGMGEIGRALAKRLVPFEMTLLYTDPAALSEPEERALTVSREPLELLLSRSDFVVLTLPLQPSTRHLINRDTLRLMKLGSYLVNPARGSLVDEDAVAAALASGRLAGYAADVFAMQDQALDDRPRGIQPALLNNPSQTLLTPHLGSAVDGVRREVALEAAASVVEALRGAVPRGALNRIRGRGAHDA